MGATSSTDTYHHHGTRGDAGMLDSIIERTRVDWQTLKTSFMLSKSAKENKMLLGCSGLTHGVSDMNMLLLIRAYSRVLLDIQVTESKKKYPGLRMMAYGSTEITSDYDVNIIGKGASECLKGVLKTHKRINGMNLAVFADTNIYVSPYVIPSQMTQDMHNICSKNKVEIENDLWLLVPMEQSLMNTEFEHVMDRFRETVKEAEKHNHHGEKPDAIMENICSASHEMDTRYNQVLKLSKHLDSILYGKNVKGHSDDDDSSDDDSADVDEKELHDKLWGTIFQLQKASIEAYIAPSTLLTVVHGMHDDVYMEKLEHQHYHTALVENLENLVRHKGFNMGRKQKWKLSKDPTSRILTIKYVYRILYAHQKYIDMTHDHPRACRLQDLPGCVDFARNVYQTRAWKEDRHWKKIGELLRCIMREI